MAERKRRVQQEQLVQRGGFWIYIWLGVSVMLNLSGMASIVDGFVTWANFFRNIIDVYRATIREPLAWIGNLIWPFGPIPGWVFDVFVIWAALVLALNIWGYRIAGNTVFGGIRDDFRKSGISEVLKDLAILIILPLFLLLLLFSDDEGRRGLRDILLNFLFLIATFIMILFINWQIRQHGW